jgi:hypothetical protein
VRREAGIVLEGRLPFTKRQVDMTKLKLPRRTRISLILGNPDEARCVGCRIRRRAQKLNATRRARTQAFSLSSMPVHGVGLARLEFIVSRIGVHPQVRRAAALAVGGCENLCRCIACAAGTILALAHPPSAPTPACALTHAGVPGVREHDGGRPAEGAHPRGDARLGDAGGVLRVQDRGGRGHHRGGVLPAARHRAHVGLQDQRGAARGMGGDTACVLVYTSVDVGTDGCWRCCAQYRRLLGGEKYEPKEEARLNAW